MLKKKLKIALAGCLLLPLTACGEVNFTPPTNISISTTSLTTTTTAIMTALPTFTAAPTATPSLATATTIPATATAAPTATIIETTIAPTPTAIPATTKPASTPTTASPAKGQVMAVFQPILAAVKRQTDLPLLLPTFIPVSSSDPKLYASSEKGEDGYYIELSFAPDCQGADACHFGGIEGHAATNNSQSGKKVKLAQNITGYYVDATCGANCSDSTLSWRQNSVTYTISVKAGKEADLVKMANSAIANGAIK